MSGYGGASLLDLLFWPALWLGAAALLFAVLSWRSRK